MNDDTPTPDTAAPTMPAATLHQSWCPECGQANVGDRHNGGAAQRFENCPGVPQAIRYQLVAEPDGCIPELDTEGRPTGRRIAVRGAK